MSLFNKKCLLSTLLIFSTFGGSASNITVSEKAKNLVLNNILIDGHIDVPYRLEEHYDDVSKATSTGDFDYPRAKKGGLDAPFMSIYIPASMEQTGGGKALADQLIDRVEAIVGRAPEKFALAYNLSDIRKNFAQGKISLPMGMENGTPIEGSFENLQHFYQRGIRYITLAHSKSNHISDSSYDENKHWQGLSPFGKKLVIEMNAIGIMVDVSHISDGAFYQVMDISKVPVIASHSSLRHFVPNFERNMSDDMLIKLKENGGVIQINFGSSFISKEANNWYKKKNAAQDTFIKNNNVSSDSNEVTAFAKQYRHEHPLPFATLDNVLDHIDHVVKLIGVDYVGLGSDYDGVGDSLPIDLKDVSQYPHLVQGLIDRGYSDEDIAKILGKNVMRVWQAVEDYATKH